LRIIVSRKATAALNAIIFRYSLATVWYIIDDTDLKGKFIIKCV